MSGAPLSSRLTSTPAKQKPKPSARKPHGGSPASSHRPATQEKGEDGNKVRSGSFISSITSPSSARTISSSIQSLTDRSPSCSIQPLTDRSPSAPYISKLRLSGLGTARPDGPVPKPLHQPSSIEAIGSGSASAVLSGGAAEALGAAPLSGFRSGRFTPRAAKTNHKAPGSQNATAMPSASASTSAPASRTTYLPGSAKEATSAVRDDLAVGRIDL